MEVGKFLLYILQKKELCIGLHMSYTWIFICRTDIENCANKGLIHCKCKEIGGSERNRTGIGKMCRKEQGMKRVDPSSTKLHHHPIPVLSSILSPLLSSIVQQQNNWCQSEETHWGSGG